MFLKVSKLPLYQRLVKQIQEMIFRGELELGDRLPSEAELCEQFGVSRTVVREATKSLVDRGLLSAEPGRGTFVTAVSTEHLADSFGLFVKASEVSTRNLIEVRELLEVKIAKLAAERASPGHLARMEGALEEMSRALEKMEGDVDAVEEFIRADCDFHMVLAEAAQNDIFYALIGSLVEEVQDMRRSSADVPVGFRKAQQHHRTMYECVSRGDSQGAAEAMRQHLLEVTRNLEAAGRAKGTIETR